MNNIALAQDAIIDSRSLLENLQDSEYLEDRQKILLGMAIEKLNLAESKMKLAAA